MTEHGRHTTFAKILFHACAGMTELSRFKNRQADAESLPTERIEIDTFHHQIASKQPRVDSITP